ncbi:MAG: PAS domain S-box protein [Ferruginibacter sp.]|nr:PAS domain S-box protein [Ferruginibacter sp.]
MLNKLLVQQVQNHLGHSTTLPMAFNALLESISVSFDRYEDTIKRLESSVNNCTNELGQLNEKLQDETAGLKQAHYELSRIFNQVNEGFFAKDIITDKYIQMSVGCEKIYGYSVEDFYTNSLLWFQVIHPDDRLLIDKENEQLNKGIQIKSSYRIFHKDTTTRWIEVKAVPVMVDGRLARVEGVVNDITEQKNAEKLLMDSEVKYRSFFENNMDGMMLSKPDGAILEANPAACEIFGATEEEICGYSRAELLDFAEPALLNLMEIRSRTGKVKGELNFFRSDRTIFRAEMASSIFKDANGEDRTCVIVRDITDRKKAEEQIADSEQRYRQIVETAQEGIWMMDKNYHTVFTNKKMCNLLEYSEGEMLDKHLTFFMGEQGRALAAPSIERRKTGISENMDLPFITKSGKHIWTNLSTSPLLNNEGQFAGGLAMVTDITKRKTDEELIKKSAASLDLKNKELKRKNTELEQFAYVASHDLQEPLRTTSSFVQLLQQQYKGKLDEKADKYLEFIVDSSDRMKVLIKDLLDYSKIGSKYEQERVDCNQVMKNVIADLNKAITDSAAIIIADNLPSISGYVTEIKQLFQNLIINAIKFRKPGEEPYLKISANLTGNYWHFSFADKGIGIDKAHHERIFIIFQRLHTRTEFEGSGIGLSHCKKIVELHHGKIWVESVQGRGSIFYFTIPEKMPGERRV